jgi:hypothetical protein
MKRIWEIALAVLFGTLALAAVYEVGGVVGEWLGIPSVPARVSAEPITAMASSETDSPGKPRIILPPKEGFRGGPTVQDPNAPITPEQQKYLDDLLRQGSLQEDGKAR